MSITTSVSATTRKPGVYVELDITSAQRGLVPEDKRLALVGAKLAAGSATVAQPRQVFAEDEADTLFGVGSELALMCRRAFRAMKKAKAQGLSSMPQVFGVPIADPGGTAAVHRFAVSGTATEAGEVVVRISGRVIRAGVASGDAAAAVATALDAAIAAHEPLLAVTAAVAASTNVDLTARNTGPNGNDIVLDVLSAPAGIAVVTSTETSGATAYDVTNALAALVDVQYHAVALANHLAADVTDAVAHTTAMRDPGTKKWTRVLMAETGTLSTATTLASGSNTDYTISTVSAEDFPNLPGEIAAEMAVFELAQRMPNYHWDNLELTLDLPATPASIPTDAEVETALLGGCSILGATDNGMAAKIIKHVSTQTVLAGAPFFEVAEVETVRTLFYVAYQCDAAIKTYLAVPENRLNDAVARAGIEDTILARLKTMEALRIVQNVDDHKDELAAEADPSVVGRVNVEVPAAIIPGLHQVVGKIRLFTNG